MALDKAAVAHIAALARIRVPEDELEPLARELSQIIGWVEQLDELDTTDVPPMTSAFADGLAMREDRVNDGNCRDALLGNAPRTSTDGGKPGFFVVPKVIE